MTVRRFYRSRLFWLGVPGLVFLVWAWWDSGGYVSNARWVRGSSMDDVRVTGGWVGWKRMTHLPPSPLAPILSVDPFTTGRNVRLEEVPLAQLCTAKTMDRQFDVPAGFEVVSRVLPAPSGQGGERTMILRVALWVVVAAYVMMWLGTVFWWQRRKARVAKRESEVVG
jgi:hypothetical protein